MEISADGVLSGLNYSIDRATKGIFVSLFRKNQLTGVREIFILEWIARHSIYFVETICRLICEDLEMEMLTKGTEKIDRSRAHFPVADKKFGGNFVTGSISGDCSTWCQQFIMPAFAAVLRPIIPDDLFWPVVRILNGVTRKRLELPAAMVEKFFSSPSIRSMDAGMNTLKDQLTKEPLSTNERNEAIGVTSETGPSTTKIENYLADFGGGFLKNRSKIGRAHV